MNDGLPTEEQLRRIREGVLDRIEARRRLAQRIAGATTAVALVAGGVGLLATTRFVGSSGASSGGDSAADQRSPALVEVRCHEGTEAHAPVHAVKVDPADLPAGAVAACARAQFQSDSGRMPTARSASGTPASRPASPAASPPPATQAAGAVCKDARGVLQVFLTTESPAAVCRAKGTTLVKP